MTFSGSYTALITPFNETGVDYDVFEQLIERQIHAGTHGLVPSGTTGESPTLNHEEHDEVIAFCTKIAAGRVKVMAGTGSNATAEAVERTKHAQQVGADCVLVMTPYYNKPTQEGMYQHFKAVHDASDIPIFLYNIPGRSVVDLADDTIARLMELPRIVGIKDATGDLSRPGRLRKINPDFIQFSGEDATAVEFNKLGGTGCISVSSNVIPDICSMMQQYTLDGKWDKAQELQDTYAALHDLMFCEPSPQPAKYALYRMGVIENRLRLPLIPVSDMSAQKLDAMLQALELV